MVLGLPYVVDDNFNDKSASNVLVTNADTITLICALRRILLLLLGALMTGMRIPTWTLQQHRTFSERSIKQLPRCLWSGGK
jgi:hypothetical protein